MKKLKNIKKKHIYFIGIGGISMSGLAKMCVSLGAKVSGSDEGDSPEIAELVSRGIKINASHKAINILDEIDLVVYTSAISPENPELLTAKALGIKCVERAEFLGKICQNYERVIAISGTHGKTTTTALIGEIFVAAGLHPTIHIGGNSVNLKTNTLIGGDEYFIVEACEYKNSFRHIKSETALITNIELDHLDYYKDYNHLHSCFVKFAKNSKQIIIDATIEINHKNKTIIDNQITAKNICFNRGGYNFDVYLKNELYAKFRLNMIGAHNVVNALYAIATSIKYNIEKNVIIKAVADFKGVERRYEKIGDIAKVAVIIDYAHHPTELKKSIAGIKQVYKKPLIIFQPHTFSRTLKLFDEFISILKLESNLILYKTYPAREREIIGGRAEDLAEILGVECFNQINTLKETIEVDIEKNQHDVVLILGAGDLANIFKKLLN